MRTTGRTRSCRVAVVAAVLAGGALAGCSAAVPGADRCLPSPLTAAPAEVAAGGRLQVSSPAFACDASYPAGATYTLSLLPDGAGNPVPLGTTPVAPDGSFSTTVAIPADVPPGQAAVDVRGSAFDEPCQDTVPGAAGSCAGYEVPVTVLPAR